MDDDARLDDSHSPRLSTVLAIDLDWNNSLRALIGLWSSVAVVALVPSNGWSLVLTVFGCPQGHLNSRNIGDSSVSRSHSNCQRSPRIVCGKPLHVASFRLCPLPSLILPPGIRNVTPSPSPSQLFNPTHLFQVALYLGPCAPQLI